MTERGTLTPGVIVENHGTGPGKWDYLVGDVREVLATLPEKSAHTIVTSPPYWGLRDYGIPPSIWGGIEECEHEWGEELGHINRKESPGVGAKQEMDASNGNYCQHCGAWRGCLGLEPTPEMFIEHIVEVCRGLWRVLRDDGTFFLNLGDCYAQGGGNSRAANTATGGLKPKDLVMMPHRVALALQADGWYVRSTIVWSKPNPMPESVTDRPTTAHEYIFLLTKKARYYYDADAVREPHAGPLHAPGNKLRDTGFGQDFGDGRELAVWGNPSGRNLRNVWHIATQPFPEAHFATFPEKIPETCIKAGTSEKGACPECGAPWERVVEVEGVSSAEYMKDRSKECFQSEQGQKQNIRADRSCFERGRTTKGFQPTCECPEHLTPVPCTVLDPFAGSGTTLAVARKLGRSAVGIDISPDYKKLAVTRARLDTRDILSYSEVISDEV